MRTRIEHGTQVAFVFMNNHDYRHRVGRGAGYVVGAMVRAGFPVVLHDTGLESIDSIAKQIVLHQVAALMVSTMSQLFPEVLELVAKVKEHKDIPVLVGGIHPTSVGSIILEQHPEIDFLCIGEGESMVVDFLNNLGTDSLYDVRNLAYRRDGRVVANALRPPEDLARLPSFPWYRFREELQSRRPLVMASRGCPYQCTYCGNWVYLRHYGTAYLRFRPIQHVIDELAMLIREYSVSSVHFADEMMLSNRGYVFELLGAVKKTLDIPYDMQGRVEDVDEELVRVLRDTGCFKFRLGVECGNEEFRKKYLNRHMSNEEIRSAFSLLRDAGIPVVSYNIIGFPFEQDKLLTRETIELNLELRPYRANFFIFYPYPGTKLHQYCVENDLIDPIKQKTFTRDQDSILRGVQLRNTVIGSSLFVNNRFALART